MYFVLTTHIHALNLANALLSHVCLLVCMRRSNFCQRGSNFDKLFYFFLVDEGREDTVTTISGPTSARQRNAIQMAFLRRADDGPTLMLAW